MVCSFFFALIWIDKAVIQELWFSSGRQWLTVTRLLRLTLEYVVLVQEWSKAYFCTWIRWNVSSLISEILESDHNSLRICRDTSLGHEDWRKMLKSASYVVQTTVKATKSKLATVYYCMVSANLWYLQLCLPLPDVHLSAISKAEELCGAELGEAGSDTRKGL